MTAKIERIDAPTLRSLGERIPEALKALADELGVTIAYSGKGRYSNGATGEITFELVVRDADGSTETRAEHEFKRYASRFGLTPEDLGREFETNGTRYAIAGLITGRQKYPLLGKRLPDGKMFKFTGDTVRRGLIALAPPPPAPVLAPPKVEVPEPKRPEPAPAAPVPIEEDDYVPIARRRTGSLEDALFGG